MSTVYIEMSFDGIYSFAVCKLKLHSSTAFSLVLPEFIKISQLAKGLPKNNLEVLAAEDKGVFLIELSAIGFINEVPIRCGDNSSDVESYGMQYFPFVSSAVNIDFKITGLNVGAISINFPDKYRVIWFRQNLEINCKKLELSHSQGEKDSVYVFTPMKKQAESIIDQNGKDIVEVVKGKIPVRMGGKEYLRIVTFPSLYFCISLIVVSILALQDKPNLTYGAVAAGWVLMLRHFNAANAPQLNTILKDIYFILGIVLLIWAICWEKYSNSRTP